MRNVGSLLLFVVFIVVFLPTEQVSSARLRTRTETARLGPRSVIGVESIFCHNHLRVGMIFPEFLPESPGGGIALTVVFRLSVLFKVHLRTKRDHLLEIKMHDGSTKCLQVISGFACLLTDLCHAEFRLELLGRKIARAVKTQEIAPIHKHHRLQSFASLELPEDLKIYRAKKLGCNFVENLPHPAVARDVLDPVDRMQVVVPCGPSQEVYECSNQKPAPAKGFKGKRELLVEVFFEDWKSYKEWGQLTKGVRFGNPTYENGNAYARE